MSYQPTKEDTDLLNKLKLIEERVWEKYFPEEQIKFRPILEESTKFYSKNLHTLKQDMFLVDQNGNTGIKNETFKKQLDKLYKSIPEKIENKILKQADEWKDFLPKFTNAYVLEIVKDENLKLYQKIITLVSVRDGIEKIALFGNINLFAPYKVAIAYLDREIKTQSDTYKELIALWDVAGKMSEEDLYYWPGTTEQLDKFYSLLLKYNLVERNPNYRFSFQEKYSPENLFIWKVANKQLIYLLFLLYGNEIIYKGIGIHEIVVLVFMKKDAPLIPHNLSTQLGRLLYKNKTTVLKGALDAKLRKMDEFIKEYHS